MKSALVEIANRSRKIAEVKQQAAKQNQQAMQYLQMQQQQLQAIQQQISVSIGDLENRIHILFKLTFSPALFLDHYRVSRVPGTSAWRTASPTPTSICRAATSRARATSRSPVCRTSPFPSWAPMVRIILHLLQDCVRCGGHTSC